MTETPRPHPDCFRCVSFFVTHDEFRPYGCRAFAMKSRLIPALEVRQASGRDCQVFSPKEHPGTAAQS